MKQYFKPVFRIAAGYAPNPGLKISCTTTDEDLELIASILGMEVSDLGGDAFAQSENCKVPVPFEIYCKFTSVANGMEAIFLS
ncbi:MAG: hypothetical protein IKT61_00885 [Clostridia bacterium]|nr:hypothetical protein [Clostridia bacterium]